MIFGVFENTNMEKCGHLLFAGAPGCTEQGSQNSQSNTYLLLSLPIQNHSSLNDRLVSI
jgi:hypothetical protein